MSHPRTASLIGGEPINPYSTPATPAIFPGGPNSAYDPLKQVLDVSVNPLLRTSGMALITLLNANAEVPLGPAR